MIRYLVIVLALLTESALGQMRKIDSLISLLKAEQIDTAKVQHLLSLSLLYEANAANDSALMAAYRGLELSQSINYLEGEIECFSQLGWISWYTGDYYNAIRFGTPVLNYRQSAHDTSSWISANALLVNSYRDQGDFHEALQMQRTMMPVTLAWDNCRNCGVAYAVIGSMYFGMEQYDSALFYIEKGLTYSGQGLSFYGWELLMAGRTLAKMNNNKLAFQYVRQSIQPLIEAPNLKDLTTAYATLSDLYYKSGQYDSAIHYGKQAVNVGESGSFNKELLEGYLALSQAYEPVDGTQALNYLKLATALKDNIYSQEKQKQITSLKFNEVLKQNEIKAAQQDADNRLKLNALLGSTFTLVVVAFLLFRNSRNKQKAKLRIEAAFDQLKSTQSQLIQSEKMASLGELTAGIAHEIQNPLNFINNFSEVNAELIDELKQELTAGKAASAEAIADSIKVNQQKINEHGRRADAIVKNMMQHSRSNAGQKEPTDINQLVDEYLRLAYHGIRAKDKSFNASCETNLDESLGKINIVPQDIGRVLLNLISNAFYAVSQKKRNEASEYRPSVTVTTARSNGVVEIRVKDNGCGMSDAVKEKIFQPFFTTKPTGEGTGLGLSLAYDIITKGHGGTIEVSSEKGLGTEFRVLIPVT